MTDHHDRIYSQDWRDWQDPEVPEYFNPTNLLLDKHMDMAVADRVALMVDTEPYTYRQVLAHVCRAAGGLTELGLAPGGEVYALIKSVAIDRHSLGLALPPKRD